MEQFINEIYQKSITLEWLKECQEYIATENVTKVIDLWNQTSISLQEWCNQLLEEDVSLAKELISAWNSAVKTNGNFKKMYYEISCNLVPCVSNILKQYTGIDVDTDNYKLVSSETGFLTVERINDNHLLYNNYDPMWESFNLAKILYDPNKNSFHLLGVGLGYLAYQIWELSLHSIDIYIYEDDSEILNYAYNYGVLDWIDSAHLHIISPSIDEDSFLKLFFIDLEKETHYVSEWKANCFLGKYAKAVRTFDFTTRTRNINQTQWDINKRRILALKPYDISELNTDSFKKDAIIVSAGPSLNECLNFLRNNKGKKTIIAISAVLKRLHSENIKPDLIVMIDPVKATREHFRNSESITEGVPLITSLVSNYNFVEAHQGPVYIIPIDSSNDNSWKNVGGTVASLGLELAYYIGAQNIYLVGSDLAYPNGTNYASGVAHKEKENVKAQTLVPSNNGEKVPTCELYNMYREIMENQISLHPTVKVFNMSTNGAKIKGAKLYSP